MNRSGKRWIKDALGELPLVPELYWQLRQPGKPISRSFTLRTVEKCLPEWNKQAQVARRRAEHGRKIFLFSTLRYWIEHATLTGVALAGQGHDVTLAYLPYANWHKPMSSFDLRRQNAYASSVFRNLEPLVRPLSLLDARLPGGNLPAVLEQAVAEVSLRDVQYTLQIEDVDRESELYRLRLERNRQAAAVVFHWLRANRPDVVVTPNGMILEMGSVYQAARYLDIPVVSYEFGEQRDRIWLAYNREVMRQDTDLLWLRYKDRPLTQEQSEQVRTLFASRQQARLWENFSRRWQGTPSQGGQQARQELGLDARPLVLLAANVIGDSLTLGRQVFSQSMTEWLTRTLDYFCGRPDVQLVVRIHPGERYTRGPSVADLLHTDRPDLPENIHLVAANDPVNTYDLVEIADLGLVYTTTVGMEMAMSGVPVIVAGQTHYRGRGFTQDPVSWEDYFQTLDLVLGDRERYSLTQAQVDQAWNYAYRFYFEYPLAFPWHLLKFGGELENWPVERVLSPEGQVAYGHAFHCLAGEPLVWPEEGKSILSADVSLSDPVEAMQPGQYLQESSP